MSDTALVLRDSSFIAPVVDVMGALARFQAMKDFIDKGLQKGRDFDVIPGTNKPTLLKPGAEKLSNFFGLAPKFEIVEKELDWTGIDHGGEQFFYFHYRCRLLRGDALAAEGEGSANSFEKKYRWRKAERVCPQCNQATIIKGKAEYGGGWVCFKAKGGCGAKFKDGDQSIEGQQVGQVKNPDIADTVNTLQKMAQKRAYVAAVLLAVNGSEYFTQDVEDFIDGHYSIEYEQPAQPVSKPAEAKPAPITVGEKITMPEEQPTEQPGATVWVNDQPPGEMKLAERDFWNAANPLIKAGKLDAKKANDIRGQYKPDWAQAIAALPA